MERSRENLPTSKMGEWGSAEVLEKYAGPDLVDQLEIAANDKE